MVVATHGNYDEAALEQAVTNKAFGWNPDGKQEMSVGFGNYDRTYGTLGGVIVFLLWLWLANCALAEISNALELSPRLSLWRAKTPLPEPTAANAPDL